MACKYYINGLTLSKDEFLNYVKKQPLEESSKILGIKTTPTAPFVTDTNAWTKLGLKTALKEAVAQGVDKIAWSTGTQQFDRWGSEKISWKKEGNKWKIDLKEQESGNAFDGINIDEKALSESNVSVSSKEQLKEVLNRNLRRERNEAEIDKLTDRIWNRMQTEDSGTSLPRKEGMEEFYGNPADMERAKNFTIKKEGELFAVKDEKGKTIRTFKQENEANKFKENYGLGIVGNVAKSLFKQDPKVTEVIQTRGATKFGTQTTEQHSIDITPELKASVESGMPLFGVAKPQSLSEYFRGKAENIRNPDKNRPVQMGFGIPKDILAKAYDMLAGFIEKGNTVAEAIGKVIKFLDNTLGTSYDAKGFEAFINKEVAEEKAKIDAEKKAKAPTLAAQINKGLGVKAPAPKVATQSAVDKAFAMGAAMTKADFDQAMADLKSDFKEFMAAYNAKQKAALQNQRNVLKQQMADFRSQQLAYGKRVSAILKYAKSKNFITDAQYRAIIRRVGQAQTPSQWNKVFSLVNRVIADAKQAEQMAEITKLQGEVRKKKHAAAKILVNQFLKIASDDIPPAYLSDYLTALTEMNAKVPNYTTLNRIFQPIEQAYKKANPAKEVDYQKSFEKAEEYFDKVQQAKANGITTVEEYRTLLRDASDFNRYIEDALQQIEDFYKNINIPTADQTKDYKDAIDAYNDMAELVGKNVEELTAPIASSIDAIKGELISDVKEAVSNIDRSRLNSQELKMIDDILAYGDSLMRKLSVVEIDALAQILENMNSSNFFDAFRLKAIEARLYSERNKEGLFKQFMDAKLFDKVFAGMEYLKEKVQTTTGAFVERTLGLSGGQTQGAFNRHVFSPIRQALANVSSSDNKALKYLDNLGKKTGLRKLKGKELERSYVKIDMIGEYLREHGKTMLDKWKNVRDSKEADQLYGKRDVFRKHERFQAAYGNRREYAIKMSIYNELLNRAISSGKAQKVADKESVTQEMDPNDVYESIFVRKDDTYLTKAEREYLLGVYDYINENARPMQEIANAMRGLPLDVEPFYKPRQRYNEQTKETGGQPYVLDEKTHNISLRASSGKEVVSEELGGLANNINNTFLNHIDEVSRDYYVTSALKNVNSLLKSTRAMITAEGDKNKSQEIKDQTKYVSASSMIIQDMLNREYGNTVRPDVATRIVKNILTGTAMKIFVAPFRTAAEIVTAGSVYSLRMGITPAAFYKNLFSLQSKNNMLVMDMLDSIYKDKGLIAKDFVKDKRGRIKSKPTNQRLIEAFAAVSERLFVATSVISKFEQEFSRITGQKFDANKFLTDQAYNQKYLLDAREAMSVADNAFSEIAGETASGTQAKYIEIIPYYSSAINEINKRFNKDLPTDLLLVDKDNVGGVVLAFLASYPFRAAVALGQSSRAIWKGDGSRAEASAKFFGVVLEGLLYQVAKNTFNALYELVAGDDEDKEKAEKKLDEMYGEKALDSATDELLAVGLQLASARAYGFGRTLTQIALTIKYNNATDKESKEYYKKLAKNVTYSELRDYDAANRWAVEKSLTTDIANSLVFINPFAQTLASAIEGGDDVVGLIKDISENGIKKGSEQEQIVYGIYGLYKVANLVAMTQGYGFRSKTLEFQGKKAERKLDPFYLTKQSLKDKKEGEDKINDAIEIDAGQQLAAMATMSSEEVQKTLMQIEFNPNYKVVLNDSSSATVNGSEVFNKIRDAAYDEEFKNNEKLALLKKVLGNKKIENIDPNTKSTYKKNVKDYIMNIKSDDQKKQLIKDAYSAGLIDIGILNEMQESKMITEDTKSIIVKTNKYKAISDIIKKSSTQ